MKNNRYFKFKDIVISNNGDYVLQSATNLETGSATSRKVNYIDTDGSEYRDIYYNERIFEISGFVQAFDSDTMVSLKRRLIAACSLKEPFELIYYNRQGEYRAECYFDKLPTFGTRKQWYLPFKLYLRIPGFYWQSAQLYNMKVFGYRDDVIDTFTLPCVFTSRINSADITNLGDCSSYPVFTVECETPAEGSSIIIINNTSGQSVKVNYQTSENEVITIDNFNQIVTSNINGNITKYIDISTRFFPIEQGINRLEVISLGNVVTLKFRENFLGV